MTKRATTKSDSQKKRRALKPRTALAVVPVLVSDESAFAACGLEPRRFRELVMKHKIPHVRDGHRVLVRAKDLEALVEKLGADVPKDEELSDGPETVGDVLATIGRCAS